MPQAALSALHFTGRARAARAAGDRRGLTLIEMLIATAVTLLMMSAVLTLFANLGGSVRNRRALIEVDGRLRQVRAQLARDLAGATCPATTWHNPGANEGYIEILEGRYTDWNPSGLLDPNSNNSLDFAVSQVPSSQLIDPTTGQVTDGAALGDADDILMLTVRNEDEPFTAIVPAGAVFGTDAVDPDADYLVESSLAEVVWYASENDGSSPDQERGMRRIYRRVRLIAPWLGDFQDNSQQLFQDPDPRNGPQSISARWDPNRNRWVANTLGDLTKRENRYLHEFDATNTDPINEYPHHLRDGLLRQIGDDPAWLLLSDALAFDMRVYDPDAPVYAVNGTAIEPSDAGWGNINVLPSSAEPVSYGAYVDLGWNLHPTGGGERRSLAGAVAQSKFQWPLRPFSLPTYPVQGYPAVYGTWSLHYESDGINQDGTRRDITGEERVWRAGIDQGANGIDDNYIGSANSPQYLNGVDDAAERETAPPYDVPLRGVKVIFRVYERDARQVRATSVIHSFVD